MTPTTDYILRLRPLSHDVPPEIRLRAALKRLRRSHGLQCVAVREVGPNAPDAPAVKGTQAAAVVAGEEPSPEDDQC